MKVVTLLLALSLSTFAFSSEEVILECKTIIKETCGDQSLESCAKKSNKDSNFETCLAILLPQVDAPMAVRDMKSDQLFDAGTKTCFDTIKKLCGEDDINSCIKEKGDRFDTRCRELVGEIDEQREKMKAVPGRCFGDSFLSCEKSQDVSMASYDVFVSGVKSMQNCMSQKVLADVACTSPIQKIIDQRKADEIAVKAKTEQ
ncbi:MAG: hypothetical protein COW00_02170 [Bdellovibrio sp. CG12_big_fil_rev_8_21_14_0_65_39_13]|nr:MAG: hypothetical protein COW78_14425 [Bdellovibrio sp. CG22_combo_CG10-13_8_21_14_all_39_27]PIQ62188.1 MAG: hypothetical protein COW00_02170 [Bdellovibrio sp. CG12_big_fil_rev_8_21_14_0_65_39_13]PIR34198.1 MAG: hypothetical protein COV37_13915 [Bdellovibrio sp. CG11_big_fil_rev_8_21_14_0_20_39_38]PJB52621.1 MAG: hypothetical protein CO099_11635 [Bdellovibrio sp. CG_4_9_14_3_um_filter_39_7]